MVTAQGNKHTQQHTRTQTLPYSGGFVFVSMYVVCSLFVARPVYQQQSAAQRRLTSAATAASSKGGKMKYKINNKYKQLCIKHK